MIDLLLMCSKIIRCFYNGIFSALLLCFFYNSLNYQQPIRLSLMIFGSLTVSIIKSKVVQRSIEKRQVNKSLIFAFIFYLVPIIVFTICHIKNISQGIAYVVLIIVGFFPINGEDAIIFQNLEEKHGTNGSRDHQSRNESKYFRLGYIFQAIGSLCPFIYLTYNESLVSYVNQTKVKLLMTFCLFLAFINTAFYAFFHLQQLKQPIKETDNQTQQKQSFLVIDNNINKIKIAIITDGIYYGLLSAPFIAYYLDLKLNFYQDSIGKMIFAFFLLKGIGYEVMNKYINYQKVFRYWSILSNCLLIVAALIPTAKLSVSSLLLAFPVWNCCKAFRKKYIQKSNNNGKIKGLQNIKYWEQLGIALGVLISSFFFSILSTKFYFGYPLFLCGVLGLLKIFIIQPLYQISINNTQFTTQFQLPTTLSQVIQQKQPIQEIKVPQNETQLKINHKSFCVYMFLGTIFFIINAFYIYHSYFGNMALSLTTRGDKILIPSKLTIVNQSLAHYLVRQNITDVKLVYCSQQCVRYYQSLQTNYNQYLKYDSQNPQWLSFLFLPYFPTQQQVVDKLQNVLIKYPKVKGFSISWTNPLLYNKMPPQIDQFLLKMPQKYGFYYSQMPSLNLRGIINQIVMIFTRTKRIKTPLPTFIKQKPPNNILAIQVTFKLLTHYRYIREYILYHLNMGVDKFFIYDNNRNPNDEQYYQEYHQVTRFLKKCVDEPIDGQYAILEEILEEFYDHVIYIPWRIGQLHPQGQAHLHYRCYFQNIVKFTSFTDMDQYLFSPTGKYIPDTLQSLLQQHQTTAILISSQSFMTRICMHNQLSIQQYRFLHQPKDRLTVKTIALTRLIVDHSIHDKSVKNGRYAYLLDDKPDIIMHHYTVHSTDNYQSDVKKYDWDYSLKPLVEGMKEACEGKCSNKIGFTCSDQEYEIAKIDFCKEPK